MIKYLVTFIAGAAVGATAAAFFVKNKEEKKSEDKIASMREYVRKLEGQILENYKGENSDSGTCEVETVGTNSQKLQDSQNRRNKIERVDMKNRESYSKYQAQYAYKTYHSDPAEYEYPSEDDDEDEDVGKYDNLMEEMSKVANSREKPKLITADAYDDIEFEHHDKVQLEFYQEDCVLFNPEEDEIVTDPEALLGDSMEKFGFIHNDERVIYVRNVSRGTDYEIVKIFDAYGE